MVLDEKRLVLKGIPVGSRVKPATGTGTGKMPDTRGFTRATCYRQLDIKVKIQTLNDARTFPLKVLLNSESTGSCIGRKFVNDNEIRTRKTAIPVLVHNADGMLNKNGSITDYVFLRLSVGDHTEQLKFAVADLGTHNLFIGHEWLKLHNPNIDWKTSEIRFDRCLKECGYVEDLQDPEADEEDERVELKPRDKLYALDMDVYL